MRRIKGLATNINKGVLGKVTRKSINPFKRADYVLVADTNNNQHGYEAIISNNINSYPTTNPLVYNVKDVGLLVDGDIVLIQPNGDINILYEKSSSHNCLMITERCNCSCVMCPQPKVTQEEDRTSLNLKLISLMDKKTEHLGLSGGEPTLMGSKLIDIVSFCKKALPGTALTLLTNGIKFDDFSFAKTLSEIRHPNLCIDIPIYSDTDTEHNKIVGAKGFYRTIQALYNLALLNQKVGIRIVINKMNHSRLSYLAEFIYRNFPFVFHIAFMQMETIGLARENLVKLWIDPFEYKEELEDAIRFLAERDMSVSVYNAQLCILSSYLRDYAKKTISDWKNIYLKECDNCDFRNECGGFFESNIDMHSRYIKPFGGTNKHI